jgi:hypothetical protein
METMDREEYQQIQGNVNMPLRVLILRELFVGQEKEFPCQVQNLRKNNTIYFN